MNKNTISLFYFFFILFIFPITSQAQKQMPDWVIEMKKPVINFQKLTKEFNDYWKDKMDTDDSKKASAESEENEFPIKEEYGWLRFYLRQYFEMINLNQQKTSLLNQKQNKKSSSRQTSLGAWTCAGPLNHPNDTHNVWGGVPFGVGRVNQLAFSGTHANVMYAIAPSGLFISTDTANTWHSTNTDFIGYNAFRSIEVDPTNDSIIYIGCGDYIFNPSLFFNSGILKSTDFGNSFTPLLNGMDSTVINAIEINPLNSNQIIAGGYGGIWKSSDAGFSWTHTLTMYDSTLTGHWVYDIKFKPGSSDSLYATSDTSFFISTDGGSTWNIGFNNFEFTDNSARGLLLGVSPAAPNYVYIATQQDFGNIYKSTDGAVNFSAIKKYQSPGLVGYDTLLGSYGQGAYNFAFSADPFDSLKIYIGSISAYESTDGGETWNTPYNSWEQYSSYFRIHPDQHFIARNPLLPDRIWVTNDGGVYSKLDSDTVFKAMQNNLSISQAYHFDADNFYDSTFAVGTQDNGAYYTNNGTDFIGYKGGDVYAKIVCAYNNNAAIYTEGFAVDIHNPPNSIPISLPEVNNYEPLSLTPVAPLTGFLANTHIWRTQNMNGIPVVWQQVFNNTSANNSFVALNHCLSDSNILYAVRYDGFLFRTTNASDASPVFDSLALPTTSLWTLSMATVPNNANKIYLCSDAIYESNNKGLSWTNITAGLTSIFNFVKIVADPYATDGSVYLLTTNKVFYKNDTSPWIDFSNQLPDVTYTNDIVVKKYNSQARKVWVSVYGRGIWQSPVYQNLISNTLTHGIYENKINIFPVPASIFITVETATDDLLIKHIIIYNVQGQQISSTKNDIGKSKLSLSVSKFANGVYFMELVTDKGVVMKKFVVEK